jgi:hypothetical protein
MINRFVIWIEKPITIQPPRYIVWLGASWVFFDIWRMIFELPLLLIDFAALF